MALVNGRGIINGCRIEPGANLTGADLESADLKGARLGGAVLVRAVLYSANLSDADLTGAHLDNANLYNARLGGANLTGADLTGADLTGADLTGAYLSGAHLRGANFSHAKVDPHHLPLIEAAYAKTLRSIRVNPRHGQFDLGDARHFSTYMPHGEVPGEESAEPYKPGRSENPGLGTRRGPHGYKY